MEVYLSAPGLPLGATATFSPGSIRFIGSSGSSGTATMTVWTTEGTPPGPNPFRVVAEDGGSHNLETNFTQLDVTLTSPGLAKMASGGICMAFKAMPGASCSIQAAADLAAPVWTTLCTTNTGTNSLLIFADMDATNYPVRFYRLATP
jgi:hypothetical protein